MALAAEKRGSAWLPASGGSLAVGVCLLWVGLLSAAYLPLLRHQGIPGARGELSTVWPADASIPRRTGSTTLVMFAHPRCPCTAASLHELRSLLEASPAIEEACIVFYRPSTTDQAWLDTDATRRAASIRGLKVIWDADSLIAGKFGARTSGHVVVYDRRDQLVFSGGITPYRGHIGDSDGHRALRELTPDESTLVCTPTFGCSLPTVGVQPPR